LLFCLEVVQGLPLVEYFKSIGRMMMGCNSGGWKMMKSS